MKLDTFKFRKIVYVKLRGTEWATKLVITLDANQQQAKYLKLSRKLTEAEVNADCEPSEAVA